MRNPALWLAISATIAFLAGLGVVAGAKWSNPEDRKRAIIGGLIVVAVTFTLVLLMFVLINRPWEPDWLTR